jgi:hypothetical protein
MFSFRKIPRFRKIPSIKIPSIKVPSIRSMATLQKITVALVISGFLFLPIAVNIGANSAPADAPRAVKHSTQPLAAADRKSVPRQPAHPATKPKPAPKPKAATKPKAAPKPKAKLRPKPKAKPRPKPKPKPSHRPARPLEGVDYSFAHPDLRQLRKAGKSFVVRYLTGGSPKELSHAEAHALRAAGLNVVSNYEETTSDLTSGGFAHGVALARRADAAHRASGGPSNAPIYFSADSSPEGWSHAEWHSFHQNLRGIASVIGLKRVGLYGGTLALKTARSHRLASWYWQSLGWRNGEWLSWGHLQQHTIEAPMGGATVDKNRALAGNYGQWGAGG